MKIGEFLSCENISTISECTLFPRFQDQIQIPILFECPYYFTKHFLNYHSLLHLENIL